MSLPLSPVRVSFPSPPWISSSPPCPLIVSLPPRPLSKSFPVYFILIATSIGVTVAGTTLIGNSIGEKNEKNSLYYFSQTIIFAVLISIIITILGLNYSDNISNIEDWLSKEHSSIYPIGRNGMHRYNNQDHSMLSAFRAAELIHSNKISAKTKSKLWEINTEQQYNEYKKLS